MPELEHGGRAASCPFCGAACQRERDWAQHDAPTCPLWDELSPSQCETALRLNAVTAAGDVIQIARDHDSLLAGCFAEVEETRTWGVIAFVLVPGGWKDGTMGQAFVRLEHGSFRRLGKSPYGLTKKRGP